MHATIVHCSENSYKTKQKQAKLEHVAFWGDPEGPLQKTSQLQIVCV